ncbi:hypothetical protein QCA50_003940 [Cerrena zonata]|uniref:F-box domain-containing protein n=1 Tax=Cerrena zonata TaxID=2478898 RepID=A0AAW0GML7_9APHY
MAAERSPAPQEPTCPIACLPPEILAMIFNHVVTDMQQQYAHDCNQLLQLNYSQEPYPDVQPYDWVHLSNVCRHWNDVVKNTLTLWGGLVLLDPYLESAGARFKEVLLKARDATIQHLHVGRVAHHLEVNHPFPVVEVPGFEMVMRNLPRTQKFTMNINQSLDELAEYAIKGDCSNLIHIELKNLGPYISDSIPSRFANTLSKVPLCSLQILFLFRVFVRDSLKLFRRTLKELYLDQDYTYFPKPEQDKLFQPQVLLDSLRDMPRLEILSLTDCMDPETSISIHPRPVESPMLKILYLEDVDYLVDKFLRCLVLPHKTKLVIKASAEANSPENQLQTLLTTVSNTLRTSWRPSIESNKLMSFLELCVNETNVQLSGSFQSDTVCQGNVDFSFSYFSFYDSSFLECAIDGIHSLYIRSANVLSLIHPSTSSVDQNFWFNILHPLQDVETLRNSVSVSTWGEPTYKNIPSLSSNHGNSSILFPKLSCLSFLFELGFTEFPHNRNNIYSYFSDFICELRQDLVSRREQGHQIQQLQIKFEFEIGGDSKCPLHTFKPIVERFEREFSGVVDHAECWVEVKRWVSQAPGLERTIFSDPGDSLKNRSCGNMCLHCRMSRG